MATDEMLHATADPQTVRPDGEPVRELIDGVEIRRGRTHGDDRGEVFEIFNPAWGVAPFPVEYVYWAMVRPHKTKGWVVHREQDDRMIILLGHVRVVLYDARPDSATQGRINELFFSERDRSLLTIPQGVFHAVQNVGEIDACFINLPSRPYNHEHPDKYRLPLDTDKIPFSLLERPGG